MKSNKQIEGFKYQLISFYIQYTTYSQLYYCQLNQLAQIFVVAIEQFQIISLILLQSQVRQTTIMHFLTLICKSVRPYLFSEYEAYYYGYLFNMILQFMVMSNFIFNFIHYRILIKTKKVQSLYQYFNQVNMINFGINKFIAYILCLMQQILLIPLLDLSIHTFHLSINSDYPNLILSLFFSIFFILQIIIYLSINNQSIEINCLNFQKLESNFADYFKLLSTLIIIILINTHIDRQQINIYVVILNLLNQMLQLKNLTYNLSTDQTVQIITTICFISLNISISVIIIFDIQFQDILLIILLPLFVTILLKQFLNIHRSLFLYRNDLDASEQRYMLAIYLKDYFFFKFSIGIRELIYMRNHWTHCRLAQCYCQNTQIMDDKSLSRSLSYDLVQAFGKSIINYLSSPLYHSLVLHYISSISKLGFNNQAFQLTNILLYSQLTRNQLSFHQNLHNNNSNNSNNKSDLESSASPLKDSQNYVNKYHQQISLLQREKILIFQEKIKSQMILQNSIKSQKIYDQISTGVQQFIQSEENNKFLRKKTQKILDLKKEFMSNNIKSNDTKNLFKFSYRLTQKINKLNNIISLRLKQFPTLKLQKLFTFFQAEILNNFFQAFNIANSHKFRNMDNGRMNKYLKIDLFSSDTNYFIITFDHHTNELHILEKSNKIHEFFGYTPQEINNFSNVEPFLPENFQGQHRELLKWFMTNGESNFFRQINQNFMRLKSGLLQSVDFMFDINLSNLRQLTFITLFKRNKNNSQFILVNKHQEICGVNSHFLENIGYEDSQHLLANDKLLQLRIEKIVPEFKKLVASMSDVMPSQSFSQQTKSYSQKEFKTMVNYFYSQTLDLEHLDKYCIRADYNQHLQERTILADINVIIKGFRDPYFILEIKDTHQLFQFTEEDQNWNFSHLTISEEISPNSPQAMVKQQYKNHSPKLQIDIAKIVHDTSSHYNNRISLHQILSPKESGELLPGNRNDHNQQCFFASKHESFSQISINFVREQKDQLNEDTHKIQQYSQLFNIQEHKEDIKIFNTNQLHTFKKSNIYQKTCIFDKYYNSDKYSATLFFLILIIQMQILMVIIYLIGNITQSNNDLNKILKLQLFNDFSGQIIIPLNIITIGQYVELDLQVFGDQNVEILRNLNNFQMNQSFFRLKGNCDLILYNDQIEDYLHRKINITHLNTLLVQVSVVESLVIILEQSYQMMILIQNNLNLIETNQIYYFIQNNLITYSDKIIEIQGDINLLITRNIYNIIDKSNILFIVCSIIIGIFIQIELFMLIKHIQIYEKILEFYDFADDYSIYQDIQRINIISSIIQKDNTAILKYNFDIEVKLHFIEQEELKRQNQHLKQKEKLMEHKVHRISKLFTLIPIFISLICTFTIIVPLDQYNRTNLNKFNEYLAHERELSLLSIHLNTIYALKYMAINNGNPQFPLMNFNRTEFIEMIDYNLELINDVFSKNQIYSYLGLNDFSKYQQILDGDLCQFLDQDFQLLTKLYCDEDSVLKRGLQIMVTEIQNNIRQEIVITNLENNYNQSSVPIEYILLLNNVISGLQDEFHHDLRYIIQSLQSQNRTIDVIIILLELGILLIIHLIVRKIYIRDFQIVKKYMFLLPQNTLLLDNQFEREFRQFIIKGNL